LALVHAKPLSCCDAAAKADGVIRHEHYDEKPFVKLIRRNVDLKVRNMPRPPPQTEPASGQLIFEKRETDVSGWN